MLMGGRAAEQITCDAVSTGASDDIRRATDLAQRAVSEFGLSGSVGPLNVGVLAAGGADDGGLGLAMGHSGMARLVEAEVKVRREGEESSRASPSKLSCRCRTRTPPAGAGGGRLAPSQRACPC